jgi:hypothetical protein
MSTSATSWAGPFGSMRAAGGGRSAAAHGAGTGACDGEYLAKHGGTER